MIYCPMKGVMHMALTNQERWQRYLEKHKGDPTRQDRKKKWAEAHPEEAKAKNREYVKRYREKKKQQSKDGD